MICLQNEPLHMALGTPEDTEFSGYRSYMGTVWAVRRPTTVLIKEFLAEILLHCFGYPTQCGIGTGPWIHIFQDTEMTDEELISYAEWKRTQKYNPLAWQQAEDWERHAWNMDVSRIGKPESWL